MNPTVGVGVVVFDSHGQFVVGERKGSHGAGTLALPGGHLEWGESFESCAAREVQEETGLAIRDVRFLTAIDDIDVKKGKHFVVILMGGIVDGEEQPKLMEPEKCVGWEWTTWEGIQNHGTPLFAPIKRLLQTRPSFHPKMYFSLGT